LLSLTGIPRVGDKPLDGRDLSPLLLKQPAEWSDRFLFSTWAGNVSVRTQKFRMDHQGNLYDMIADPGQTTPVNNQYPDAAKEFQEEIAQWKRDVLSAKRQADDGNPAKAKGKKAANAVDPRPIPVGYREFPITMLPARDGER
jgi:hypothetical protein